MINLDDMFEKQTILVVDDLPENIHLLSDILRPYYKVKSAINGNVEIKMSCAEDKPDIFY